MAGAIDDIQNDFESNIKWQLLNTSAMLSWLVLWAAEVVDKFKVQEYGRTAYEAITKHKCNHLIVRSGELIH